MKNNEPGVFMAFEETAEELAKNVRSLGFDLNQLAEQKQLVVDYIHVERSEIEETGEYDLEALFIRLGYAIDSLGAKRVVKYRGSSHGTNEYPFLIDEGSVDVLPITSLGLNHAASSERISTGLPRLDAMFGGQGCYRGSSVPVSCTAGTGTSSLAATFVDAACRRGEKASYFAFEESPSQIIRNRRSIGIDLEPHVQQGLLQFRVARPTLHGWRRTWQRCTRPFGTSCRKWW